MQAQVQHSALGGMAGSKADPAALLRLYLAHGRLQEAAQLAIQHLTLLQEQAWGPHAAGLSAIEQKGSCLV